MATSPCYPWTRPRSWETTDRPQQPAPCASFSMQPPTSLNAGDPRRTSPLLRPFGELPPLTDSSIWNNPAMDELGISDLPAHRQSRLESQGSGAAAPDLPVPDLSFSCLAFPAASCVAMALELRRRCL